MSIRFNFQDEFVKFLFSEYPIEVLSLKISDIKSLNFDNEYTLYENYRLISDKYFAYPLLPKEDSSLNSPDIIEYGHFPTNGQEVIINQGFAHTYYPGIPFEDIIGRPLICSGNSFIIAGILSDLTQGNKVDIVYYLNYYQAVDQPQHYEQPTVFIPYETIVQVGEIVDSEYKVIKFEGLYGNWDTVEIFRQKCGGVLSPWDRDILESQTLIEKVFLIVIEYINGDEALKDIDFLTWYLKKGDVIQFKLSDGTFTHSMIIYDDNEICDGNHRGQSGTCSGKDKKELLYAQHSTNSAGNYNNGHVRALLENNDNRIVFTKIKRDV